MSVSDFYDDYTEQQFQKGIHIRHRTILKNLKEAGLKSDSKVLEVGCGIGTVTHLIAKATPQGKVLAVDISPKSIDMARRFNQQFNHVEFAVSDMTDFNRPEKFDFVVLPDVIEHIPLEQHPNLFQVISRHLHKKSVVAINIPHPLYLTWVREHQPELLQVIDQPIHTDELLRNTYAAGLYLHKLDSYSLFSQAEDYQWILLKQRLVPETVQPKSKVDLKLQDLSSKWL
ncbi:class I SAM-dependent methyltransferase [Rufibacter sediminis]|uniref:Class I SAM-dependent methyltransferase n=1 Tax=Rufibacter sediminis TaxID=2762756 RepID=A0ABR6VLM0_9BACT|nr:class I SAM-dependent methyltransferase [Rufibacter sediminis]MBC3538141.1 class I SAM-dependent methyltransferase [Rufibacter sediminis]